MPGAPGTPLILAGAPFDVFFAADRAHPQHLRDALGLPADRVTTYALGALVLVTQDPAVQTLDDLHDYAGRVIIANPLQAPYGAAADQLLDRLGFSGTRVRANNVSQARPSIHPLPVGRISPYRCSFRSFRRSSSADSAFHVCCRGRDLVFATEHTVP